MKANRIPFALVTAIGLLGPSAAIGDDATLEQHFARTAQQQGNTYQVGRELLERQGKTIVPLLKQKQDSKDWRERPLARSLLLRIEAPDRVAAWRQIFEYGFHKYELAKDGTIKIQTDGEAIVLDRRGVPLLLDYLRDSIPDISRGSGSPAVWQRVVACVGHLGDPESVPALLEAHEFTPSQKSGIPDALVKIGKPAVTLIREAVRTCPVAQPDTQTEEHRHDWYRMIGSAGLAHALARLGDTESGPMLIAKLKESRYNGQVEGYAAALAELKVAAALPVIFDRLLQSAEQHRNYHTGSWDSVHYGELRQSLVAYGATALNFLRERAADTQPLATRVTAVGLLYELELADDTANFYRALRADDRFGRPEKPPADPVAFGRTLFWTYAAGVACHEAVPQPLLLERANVFGIQNDLIRVAQLGKDPLAFAVVREAMLAPRAHDRRPDLLLVALAESGNADILDLARTMVERHPSAPLLSAVIESALILASPKAVPLLEEVVRRVPDFKKRGIAGTQEIAALATAVVPAVKGDGDELVKLLANELPAIRDAAARRWPARATCGPVPVLVKDAAAGGASFANLRDALVRLGKPTVPTLEKTIKESKDDLVRLLCESVIVRITQPDLVQKFIEASEFRDPGFMSHVGPTVQTYQAAGVRVAQTVGPAAVPLLEAALAFHEEPPHPLTAMFALAHFKQARSIPIIVRAAPDARGFRDGNPVAVALNQFGENGIAAAKSIPAPDPDKDGFDTRAARHRAGTEALTLAKDAQGVDNIIAALKMPKPENASDQRAWAARMQSYLSLAKKYNDRRLIDPILGLVDPRRAEVGLTALEAVAAYDDPRIVPLAADWLGHDEREYYANRALHVLARRLQAETVPFLVKRLQESKQDSEKLTLIRALDNFAKYPPLDDQTKNDAAIAAGRDQALDPLIALLKNPSRSIQDTAANALVSWVSGRRQSIRDKRATKPLADWVRGGGTPSVAVIDHLTRSRTADAGPALLVAYRAGGGKNSHIAQALGQLRYEDALPDLEEALKQRLAATGKGSFAYAEMTALADLGEKGLARLHEVVRTEKVLTARVAAAQVVSSRGYAKAYDDVAALFDEVIARGPDNPGLTEPVSYRPEQRYAEALRTLTASLGSLDRTRAYAKFASSFVATKDVTLRNVLAHQMQKMEQNYPELKKLPLVP